MFEAAEVGSSIAKSELRKQVPVLRHELLVLQQELLELAEFPVIVVFAGVDGAGKGQTVNLFSALFLVPARCGARATFS